MFLQYIVSSLSYCCCPVTPRMMALASPCASSRNNFPNVKASFQSSLVRIPRARSIAVPTAAKIDPCLGASFSLLVRGVFGSLASTDPFSLRRHARTTRGPDAPRARKDDVPTTYRYPPMTKRPEFWWRVLALIPYLVPLHECWLYAETAYSVTPFLEDFELFTYPFFLSLGMLPGWFLMGYFFGAYLGIVRRKEWPHFLRYHVIMGMLLEIALQVVGTISDWMPASIYWGKFGAHFWTAVAFAHLMSTFQCAVCALFGAYPDVPFLSTAAYIQIPYD